MGHPLGVYIVSLTEMWERFSYYIALSILVLFMMQVLHFSPEFSTFLYGIIIGITYLFQLVSGYLADKYISNRHSIIIGGILMFISLLIFTYDASLFYLTLNVPIHSSLYFNYPELIFFIGVMVMTVGTGFFKVSVTSFVGLFYESGDESIDSAYTIFYMFINIGAFFAPFIAHFIVGVDNPSLYQYGFLTGAFIILFGTILFVALQKYLCMPNGEPVGVVPISKDERFIKIKSDNEKFSNEKLTKVEINHIKVILLALIVVILFFGSFEQISTSLVVFDLIYVNNIIPFTNYTITPELFLSIPPLLIIILSPIFLKITSMLSNRNRNPSSIFKFGFGLIFASLGFVSLLLSLYTYNGNNSISLIWLLIFSFFVVIGELMVIPVTFSFISKLTPPKYTSLMMGCMFAATAVGEFVAGLFACAMPQSFGETTMLLNFIPIHGVMSFMWVFIIMLAGSGLIWLLFKGRIKKLINVEID